MSYTHPSADLRFIPREATNLNRGEATLQVISNPLGAFLMSLHLIEVEETLEARWSSTPLLTRNIQVYLHSTLPAIFQYDSYITNIFTVTSGSPANISKAEKDVILDSWISGALSGEAQAMASGLTNFSSTHAALTYDNRPVRRGFIVNAQVILLSENDRLARFKFGLQIPDPDGVIF